LILVAKIDKCSGQNYYNDTQRYQQLQEQQRQQQQYEGHGPKNVDPKHRLQEANAQQQKQRRAFKIRPKQD
jgi:hypothetical protein